MEAEDLSSMVEEREERVGSPNGCSIVQAPSSSSPSRLQLVFKGWRNPNHNWSQWVSKLLPLHKTLWREVGILDAILTSTYTIPKSRAQDLFLGLVEFWCSDTNTFVFQWGEATVTLEEILILGGYPVLGESPTTPLPNQLLHLEQRLIQERAQFNKTPAKKAADGAWIQHYMGSNSDIEHIAFLSLWLSRYVFPNSPADTVGKHVFTIAIKLAHGMQLALAPAVLASVYSDLNELKWSVSLSPLVQSITLWGPLQLLQMWVFEHFRFNSNITNLLAPTEPRSARWHKVALDSAFPIHSILNSLHNFDWQPYSSTVSKVEAEDEEEELMTSFADCLRPCNLVGLDGRVEKYLPYRVGRQFGFDQDISAKFSLNSLSLMD